MYVNNKDWYMLVADSDWIKYKQFIFNSWYNMQLITQLHLMYIKNIFRWFKADELHFSIIATNFPKRILWVDVNKTTRKKHILLRYLQKSIAMCIWRKLQVWKWWWGCILNWTRLSETTPPFRTPLWLQNIDCLNNIV